MIGITLGTPTGRKLKATWTIEADQDLRSMINQSAVDNLTKILAEEITAEIDAEIYRDLKNQAIIKAKKKQLEFCMRV